MFSALRPDAGSYNKLLVSLGLLAIAAGVLVPWLLLKDSGVLQISQSDFAQMTPAGRSTLEQRQDVVRFLQSWVWIVPVILIPSGVVLVMLGASRLRARQRLEDRQLTAQVLIQERDVTVEPQSVEEREEKLLDDVVAGSPGEVTGRAVPAVPGGVGDAGEIVRAPQRLTDLRSESREVEAQVLERVRAIVPSGYSFEEHLKVSGDDSTLLLDALLRGENPPDVIIEIKLVRGPRPSRLMLDQALAQAVSYRRLVGRAAWTWLIVVVREPGVRDQIQRQLDRNVAPDLVQTTAVTDVVDIRHIPEPAPGTGYLDL